MKKLFALALCVLLVCMAGTAMAASSGTCGKTSNVGGAASVTWGLDDFGTLTISGSGAMYDYWVGDDSPWEGDNSIKAVVIESGVTSIGSYAFEDCNALTSATIADTVTSIGDYAFYWADSLAEVIFTGDSQLSSIDSQAFFSCEALKSITLPATLNKIEYDVFEHCDNLEAVHIAEGGMAYKSVDGVVYSADGKTLVIYPKGKKDESYVIPDGVTEIGSAALIFNNHLVNVTIPESVTAIGTRAFWSCTNLANVVFSVDSQLTTIGEGAFAYCKAMKTLTIPAGVTFIDSNALMHCTGLTDVNVAEGNKVYKSVDGVLYTADGKTLVCYPLGKTGESFTTPEGVTTIGERAFCNNTKIKTITLSEGVIRISDRAFFFCESMKTVTIPASVTTIGVDAFNSCKALTTVNVPCNWDDSLYAFDEGVTVNLYHSPVYTASGNVITKSCSVCKVELGTATLTTTDAVYNGSAHETATVAYSEGWTGGELTVIYENNVSAGIATASMTCEGVTASETFIVQRALGELPDGTTYRGEELSTDFTMGETITVRATAQIAQTFRLTRMAQPTAYDNTMTLYYGGKQLCAPVSPDENGVFTAQYDTDGGTLPLGPTSMQAVFSGSDNLEGTTIELYFTIHPAPVEEAVTDGEAISLTAPVEGNSYQWYKVEGNELVALEDDAVFSGTQSGTLTIKKADLTDSGEYVCMVFSDKGVTTAAFTVTVKPMSALPQTGDHSALSLWLALMALAGAGMMMLRRREQN